MNATKKRDNLDNFAVVYGLLAMIKHLGLYAEFIVILALFDSKFPNLAQHFKNSLLFLPYTAKN